MDFRELDENGSTVCPQCKKHYKPVLGERLKGDNRPIQQIFPNSKPFEREQLITGLCSDECWNKYLGHRRRLRQIQSQQNRESATKASAKCGGNVVAMAAWVRGRQTYRCEKCGEIYYQYRKKCDKEMVE